MSGKQHCPFCVISTCILLLYVPQNICDNEIETCYSKDFPENNGAYNTHGDVLQRHGLEQRVSQKTIVEQIQLFDWNELQRDIKPIIQQCNRGEERSLCQPR